MSRHALVHCPLTTHQAQGQHRSGSSFGEHCTLLYLLVRDRQHVLLSDEFFRPTFAQRR